MAKTVSTGMAAFGAAALVMLILAVWVWTEEESEFLLAAGLFAAVAAFAMHWFWADAGEVGQPAMAWTVVMVLPYLPILYDHVMVIANRGSTAFLYGESPGWLVLPFLAYLVVREWHRRKAAA